jgi:hypothetical protein
MKLQLGPAVAWCSSILVGSYSKQLVTLLAYLFPYICIDKFRACFRGSQVSIPVKMLASSQVVPINMPALYQVCKLN